MRDALHNTHVAGINKYHGQEIGVGRWPAIITRARWDFAQELLAFRASATLGERAKRKAPRAYILRGVVVCGKCGTAMAGCSGTVYRCTRADRPDDKKCARTMAAEPLEKFVEDAAIRLLENLEIGPKRTRSAAIEAAEREIDEDERRKAELHDMWISKEIDSTQYRKDLRTINARIRETRKRQSSRSSHPTR